MMGYGYDATSPVPPQREQSSVWVDLERFGQGFFALSLRLGRGLDSLFLDPCLDGIDYYARLMMMAPMSTVTAPQR